MTSLYPVNGLMQALRSKAKNRERDRAAAWGESADPFLAFHWTKLGFHHCPCQYDDFISSIEYAVQRYCWNVASALVFGSKLLLFPFGKVETKAEHFINIKMVAWALYRIRRVGLQLPEVLLLWALPQASCKARICRDGINFICLFCTNPLSLVYCFIVVVNLHADFELLSFVISSLIA